MVCSGDDVFFTILCYMLDTKIFDFMNIVIYKYQFFLRGKNLNKYFNLYKNWFIKYLVLSTNVIVLWLLLGPQVDIKTYSKNVWWKFSN